MATTSGKVSMGIIILVLIATAIGAAPGGTPSGERAPGSTTFEVRLPTS